MLRVNLVKYPWDSGAVFRDYRGIIMVPGVLECDGCIMQSAVVVRIQHGDHHSQEGGREFLFQRRFPRQLDSTIIRIAGALEADHLLVMETVSASDAVRILESVDRPGHCMKDSVFADCQDRIARFALRLKMNALDCIKLNMSCRVIQLAYRRAIANPEYLMCRRRLLQEFQEL
jgi:hypothetical protein